MTSASRITQLNSVVSEMAIAAGLPTPPIYVIPDHDPNAFATGRDPARASIAVTRGLLDVVAAVVGAIALWGAILQRDSL